MPDRGEGPHGQLISHSGLQAGLQDPRAFGNMQASLDLAWQGRDALSQKQRNIALATAPETGHSNTRIPIRTGEAS